MIQPYDTQVRLPVGSTTSTDNALSAQMSNFLLKSHNSGGLESLDHEF